MYLTGIGTAAPPARYTRMDCWEAFERSSWYRRLEPRAVQLVRAVLQTDNGMQARHLAVDSLREVFEIDPDVLQRRFMSAAPLLATEAAQGALRDAALTAADLDAVIVSTCTGYTCPGLSGYVSERLGLSGSVPGFDLVGHGCAAALPNMRLGDALLSAGQYRHVLSVCVEICSAAMYLDDDPGVLVSACLFGDGAGAAVLSQEPPRAGTPPRGGTRRHDLRWRDSESLLDPGARATLRFEQRHGLLRNVLTRQVPTLAADYARRVLDQVLARRGLSARQISTWILHSGGREVLQQLERRLELRSEDLRYSAAVLREYGNLSSAFLYFALQAAVDDPAPAGWWWLCSFGAGFSCHGALLEVR